MNRSSGSPIRVGLIVTGRGEEQFIHDLFNRALRRKANCLFSVVGRVPQLSPPTSPRKRIKTTGASREEESWDERIGLMAHGFLRRYPDSLVILLDDMEHDRRSGIDGVFARYRDALNSVLAPPAMTHLAAVHFLKNMLEAYYLAHATAVNTVAGAVVLRADHPDDVENIRDPKADLSRLWPRKFREIEDGSKIVRALDLAHVLARPEECCWLRSIVAWCLDRFHERNVTYAGIEPDPFLVNTGCKAPLTYKQNKPAEQGEPSVRE